MSSAICLPYRFHVVKYHCFYILDAQKQKTVLTLLAKQKPLWHGGGFRSLQDIHPVQGSLPSADSYGISAASVTLSRLQTDTQAHPGGSASEQTPHRPEACRSRLLSPVFSTFPRDLRTEVLGAPCTERHLRNLQKSLAPGPSGNADGSSAHGPSSSKALIRVWSVEHWDVSAASASCLPYASPDGTARTFPVAPVASPSSADSWILRTRGDSDTSGPCCCPPVPCRSLSRPTDAH